MVGRGISDEGLLGVDVNVGWQNCSGNMSDFKLLQYASEENEKLLFSQRLSKTVSFAYTKWDDIFIADKFSIFIDEASWVKHIRIFKQLRVVHCVVETAHDCGTPRDGVGTNLDIFQGMVWNSHVCQAAHSQTLKQDSTGVWHVVLVIQAREAISANNLQIKKQD